jgi:hypothetical protein
MAVVVLVLVAAAAAAKRAAAQRRDARVREHGASPASAVGAAVRRDASALVAEPVVVVGVGGFWVVEASRELARQAGWAAAPASLSKTFWSRRSFRGEGARYTAGSAVGVTQLEHQLPLGAWVGHDERGRVRAARAAAAPGVGRAAVGRAAGGRKGAEHLGQLRERQAEAHVAAAVVGPLVLGEELWIGWWGGGVVCVCEVGFFVGERERGGGEAP